MKLTKTQLREIIREELLNEKRKTVGGYKGPKTVGGLVKILKKLDQSKQISYGTNDTSGDYDSATFQEEFGPKGSWYLMILK